MKGTWGSIWGYFLYVINFLIKKLLLCHLFSFILFVCGCFCLFCFFYKPKFCRVLWALYISHFSCYWNDLWIKIKESGLFLQNVHCISFGFLSFYSSLEFIELCLEEWTTITIMIYGKYCSEFSEEMKESLQKDFHVILEESYCILRMISSCPQVHLHPFTFPASNKPFFQFCLYIWEVR